MILSYNLEFFYFRDKHRVQQYCFSALRIFILNAFIHMRCDEGHLYLQTC